MALDVENKENEVSLPHGPFYMPIAKLSRFLFIVNHIVLK